MRPTVRFLTDDIAARVIEEGFALLAEPGIRIHNQEALDLLARAGAAVDPQAQIAHIPEALARASLESAPREFRLYGLDGRPAVHYGGDDVHFDPGSAAISILDGETQQRPPLTEDLPGSSSSSRCCRRSTHRARR
jgi:trimethylamine--corrinoid protein Co-methyltransferase